MFTVDDVSGGNSDDGNGASPYDEPTGAFELPDSARQPQSRPRPGEDVDRDSFYDRHARAGLRRVDDLDDLDPGEVETVTPSVRGRRQDPSVRPDQPPAAPVAAEWRAPDQAGVPGQAGAQGWDVPQSAPAAVQASAPESGDFSGDVRSADTGDTSADVATEPIASAPAGPDPTPDRAWPDQAESDQAWPDQAESGQAWPDQESDQAGPDQGSEPTEVVERPAGRAVPQRIESVKKSRWAAFRPGGGAKQDEPPADPGAQEQPGEATGYAAAPHTDDTEAQPSATAAPATDPDPDPATVATASIRNPVPIDDAADDEYPAGPATPQPTQELLPEPAMAYSAVGPALYDERWSDDPGEPARVDTAETSVLDPRDTVDPAADHTQAAEGTETRRGTLDVGLLVLRAAVGAAALAHGLQKLFGWWNGPGLDGFEDFLVNAADPSIGFDSSAAGWLSVLGAVSEAAGGALLILGLLTPVAASAVLGVMLVAATFKVTLAGGLWYFTGSGVGIEYEVTLICAALAILLTGPGRLALDYGRGWTTRPLWGSLGLVVVSVAAAVTIWVLFNGTNPLDSPGNPAP